MSRVLGEWISLPTTPLGRLVFIQSRKFILKNAPELFGTVFFTSKRGSNAKQKEII